MSELYTCPSCGHRATAKAFDDATCAHMRHTAPQGWHVRSLSTGDAVCCWYVCPGCKNEVDGDALIASTRKAV